MSHDIDLTQKLHARVKAGVKELDELAGKLLTYQEHAESLRRDTQSYMMALAAETRKTDNPYRIQELPQINMSIVRSPVEVDDKATVLENFKLVSTSATTKKRGKALDVSNDTPTGVVRNIFIGAADRSLTIDQILAAVPEGVPFEVSKDFIYRALPRMVKRKEILRTDKGKYRYNESFA